jgi:hypothetical protein
MPFTIASAITTAAVAMLRAVMFVIAPLRRL